MTRSSALKRPPAPLPSAPAGELGTAIDRERRRGRGTGSNASGRYEPLARVAFRLRASRSRVFAVALPA